VGPGPGLPVCREGQECGALGGAVLVLAGGPLPLIAPPPPPPPACRLTLHATQSLLFLCLLIADVMIQQHQLLTRSSFAGQYEPLLGAGGRASSGGAKRW
jgi:hypothetical protein